METKTSKENKKEEVLQAIRDACPELKEDDWITFDCDICLNCGQEPVEKEIHLEHLLRAIDRPRNFIDTNGTIGEMTKVNPLTIEKKAKYNLTKSVDENLNDQELLDFLHTLLITK